MPPLLDDPRIRQTWNQLSHNAEQATESAATGIWIFQQRYVAPAWADIVEAVRACGGAGGYCCGDRARGRVRPEQDFDFYDDWEREGEEYGWEGSGAGGAAGDGAGRGELDRLLAGGERGEPGRKEGMSYGTGRGGDRKRRGGEYGAGTAEASTFKSSTGRLAFLNRLPQSLRLAGTLRYQPSAADLKEQLGQRDGQDAWHEDEEAVALLDDDDDDDNIAPGERKGKGHARRDHDTRSGHARKRSSTISSAATSDTFRSRGDLFASDDEDDAVPLGDEFALHLGRRTASSGSMKSRTTMASQRSATRLVLQRAESDDRKGIDEEASPTQDHLPTTQDLQEEEEALQRHEDAELLRKRQDAQSLAAEKGLTMEKTPSKVSDEDFVPARLPHFR